MNSKLYCREDISLIENYEKALADNTQTWHIHHRCETEFNLPQIDLIKNEMYFFRPADELIFLTPGEHSRLHNKQRSKEMLPITKGSHLSDEHKAKISAKLKGRKMSKEHCDKISTKLKGRHFSDEHKAKISAKLKGRTAPNKGVPRSKEVIEKIKNTIANWSDEYKQELYERIANKNRGRKNSDETRKRMSEAAKNIAKK